ncbi:PVC-type heme-binding CxxCH protein [Fibrella forsythiae]|uniref:ThuA domain-containing protein n=1 Tax=Fibrella forsythiae TaxID=2817061 RepID=A0ABS3JN40_9BACT|nr:PVC-type heme-binding CxxCH protein [Fibrella forsythiae]MBO0951431.1 ThuA domain-containing protein [Fibrella forsythiae]
MKWSIFPLLLAFMLYQGCTNTARTSRQPANQGTNLSQSGATGPRRGEVLFLGNTGKHHDSGKYAPWLAISLFKKGVNLTYTTNLNDLNEENLSHYDGLIIYANHDSLSPSQEMAMKSFVEGGKGLIPLHSASGCFKNSAWYIKTIGGQFKSHKTGSIAAVIVNKNHPVMQGLAPFTTSWDETYVHQNLNPDMTVLTARKEGDRQEPYTWVRTQGKGRVFYTAYGHNDSTWTNPGFRELVNNGVLWALGEPVKKQIAQLTIPKVDIYDAAGIAIGDYTKRYMVPKMQEALKPEESVKLMQVPVDFDIQLFAAEPDITNPIAMSWDERGRLWIVESVDYPNTFLETDGAANDRIKICEDTNGDGKADKFTVFADKLNIPTSMVFANGGVVVAMAPHLVFLKDTNGDDKADVRENIMSGWEKNDTHFGPSNLQYGFNNKIWGVVGSGYNGTTRDGKLMNFRTGVYNLNPDGTNVDFLANTSNNTWGLGFSEDNNVFISTANNTHSAFYSMPSRYMQRNLPGSTMQAVQKIDGHYDSHTMTPNMRQVDVVGGFTSAAGHHFYTARSFPKSYWNRVAFVCEPTVRVIHNAVVEPNGAGFAEKDGWNFLASSDEWVGPVQAEVGPDGALWVADWYNFIIQHNVFVERQAPSQMVLPFKEQPRGQGNAFDSPLRDINFGRVYRVVYKKAQPYKPVTLSKNDPAGLIAALKSDNMFWRMTAQRLIVESKNTALLPDLYRIIASPEVDAIGLNSPAVHAIWTLHGLGTLSGSNNEAIQAVSAALSHKAAGVRKAAIDVLPRTGQTLDILQKVGLMNDPNLNVRMAAMLALAAMPPSDAVGAALYRASLQSENEADEWIGRALFAAAAVHREGFLAEATRNPGATTSEKSLNRRLLSGINQEVYALQRRATIALPPDVTGREIIVKGSAAKGNRDMEGFIVGQGGQDAGYGLYMKDGHLTMAVKQNGQVYTAATTDPLPEKFDFESRFVNNGDMIVLVNGKEMAKAKAPSLFTKPLADVIRSQRDVTTENSIGAYAGAYTTPFDFVGNVQNATLEVRKPTGAPPVTTAKAVTNDKATVLTIRVVEEQMKYDTKMITVKAGLPVVLTLENPDIMQHNLVICKPGMAEKVGKAADALSRDPKAVERNYVPQMPEVLASTKLVNPGESFTLEFTAPTQPGDYPFVCTFPGHWSIMRGVMRVEKAPAPASK